jgi:putative endonuclease
MNQNNDTMKKTFYVHILTNKKNGTLYTGITNDLKRRIPEHKSGTGKSFTKRYNVKMLVYYEVTNYILNAIQREKQIKGWVRRKKIELIESMNPDWDDLSEEWTEENGSIDSSKVSCDSSEQTFPYSKNSSKKE